MYDDLGVVRVSALTAADVRALRDRMRAKKKKPSTIANVMMPLHLIYRRALEDGVVAVSPLAGITIGKSGGERTIAEPAEAAKLLRALPDDQRALWTAAFYSGMRLGELRALRWTAVDLDEGVMHVRSSYCGRTRQEVAPKSAKGRRQVPIVQPLRVLLEPMKAAAATDDGYVFAAPGGAPFEPSTVYKSAKKAWKDAELTAVTPHQARHSFASYMIASGVGPRISRR